MTTSLSPDSAGSADQRSSLGIVVLGMHRSGTSATARLLGELGCDFGGELLPGREDNPAGYFEHKDIVETHNDFLRAVGRSWDDPRPWQDELGSDAASQARERLEEIFERDFAPRKLWVLKDPRLCRLLPLWDDIFGRADVRFAVVHRHPLAVARSLERRDGMDRSRALMLWLRHVLEAETGTRGRRRAYLRFEKLIARPEEVLTGVMERFRLPDLLKTSDGAADRALEPSQLHHRADDEDRAMLRADYPWVERCHRALCALDDAAHDVFSDEADALRSEVATADRLYDSGVVAPLVDRLDDCNVDRAQLRRATEQKDRDLASLQEAREREVTEHEAHVESLKESVSRHEAERRDRDAYVVSLKESIAHHEADRQRRDEYVASLKEALERAEAYSKSLEQGLAELDSSNAEYTASLRQTLEAKEEHLSELRRRLGELEDSRESRLEGE